MESNTVVCHNSAQCHALRESLEFSNASGDGGEWNPEGNCQKTDRELKGTNFSMKDQFPKEILQHRRILLKSEDSWRKDPGQSSRWIMLLVRCSTTRRPSPGSTR